MRPASRVDLVVAAVFCGAIGLGDVLYVAAMLSGRPTIGPALNGLFPDFLVFYAATQAYLEGKLALVYDSAAFTQFQNALFYPGHLPQPLHFRPFFYPPTWLLMLLPFGLMGVVTAYGLFLGLTAAAATALEGRRDGWGWLAIVTSPAAVWVVLAGQNTFLSIALLYAGLRWLDRSPAAAGVLLGLLSYKPQVWVLVPLAMLAARQWRALSWTVGTVAMMSLLSLATFGLDFWLAFVEASREAASARVVDEMFQRFFMHMTTLLAAARIAGLPPALAAAIQLGGALLSNRRAGDRHVPGLALHAELRPPPAHAGRCGAIPPSYRRGLLPAGAAALSYPLVDSDGVLGPQSDRPADHAAGRPGLRRHRLDAAPGPTQSRIAERGNGGLKPQQFAAKSLREEIHGR
jgi:hypothetical protein